MQMRNTRQPSSFNEVLAASCRSFFIDRVIMGKRWHIQFPIPLFSFLCPSNTKDFGRFGLQTECLSHFDKEKNYSEFGTPWKTLHQNTEHYYFFIIPETQITLFSSFSFQNKNCYGSLFSPKESLWFHDRLKASGLRFNHKMYSLITSLKQKYVCVFDNVLCRNYIIA